jgi:hypothetical protein
MPVADWTRTEDWEVLLLANRRMPGVAHVEINFPSGLDIQKPKGAKKAKIKDMGTPPAELNIELELLPEDLADLDGVISLLRPRSVFGPRDPLAISHPNARLWGINVVTIGEIRSPQPGPGGTLVLKFTAIQYAAPTKLKKAKEKPKTDDPSGWDVPPLVDALRPGGMSGGVQANFSSGDIPGSGFSS